MSDILISCAGFNIEGFRIPAFELKRGDVLCLKCPFACMDEMQDCLSEIFSGKTKHSAVKVCGRVSQISLPVFRESLFGSQRLAKWLLGLLPEWGRLLWFQIPLGYLDISGKHPVLVRRSEVKRVRRASYMARRTLTNAGGDNLCRIGFGMLPDDSDVFIFGNHIGGPVVLYECVAEYLPRRAAIELSFEKSRAGQRYFSCYPRSLNLEITIQSD